jgi:UDP-glucose 4-epimerase
MKSAALSSHSCLSLRASDPDPCERYAAAVPKAPASIGGAAGNPRGTRALVIGSGFIGSHVVAELARRRQPPAVLTRSRPAEAIAALVPQHDLHLGDAADRDTLEATLDGIGHVFYCAGGLLPAASEEDPERDAELTLRPLRAVLDAVRGHPGTKLTYISSGGTVYGEPDRIPVPETAPTGPHGSYGRLHLACEGEIEQDRAEHGLLARILRCSSVYGEYQWPNRGQGAIVTFLHRIDHGEPIHLYGTGQTVRDYVYAGDVAKAAVDLADLDGGPSVLNVGAGTGTSLLDLLRLAEKQAGQAARVEWHPERGFEIQRIVLDTSALRTLIDFVPTPLEIGVERTHDWLRTVAAEPV